jgi:hypothetical protein
VADRTVGDDRQQQGRRQALRIPAGALGEDAELLAHGIHRYLGGLGVRIMDHGVLLLSEVGYS